MLRVITYLAPSLPLELFETLTDHLAGALGTAGHLSVDESRSGPRPGEDDPFSRGEADLGFVCATSYVWLTDRPVCPVELAAAWVPDDPRCLDRAVYFADVVVRSDSPVSTFDELAGAAFAYNDDASLSGYHSLRFQLRERGLDDSHLGAMVLSGSHLRSLAMVEAGDVDAAAVDSVALRLQRNRRPALDQAIRVIDTWGPHPVQATVLRATLPAHDRAVLRSALLSAHDDPIVGPALAAAGLLRFDAVGDAHYAPVRSALASQP